MRMPLRDPDAPLPPPQVASLCLWLLFELVYFAPDSQDLTPFVVRLIGAETLSVTKRMLLLTMFRAWLHDLKVPRGPALRSEPLYWRIKKVLIYQ